MNKSEFEKSATEIRAAADSLSEHAQAFENATDSVRRSAEIVESNVSEGIQPDLRELKMYMSDLTAATDIRIRRIVVVLWALAILNLVTILVALAF